MRVASLQIDVKNVTFPRSALQENPKPKANFRIYILENGQRARVASPYFPFYAECFGCAFPMGDKGRRFGPDLSL